MLEKRVVFCCTHSLIALMVGLITYCVFRPDTYISQEIYKILDIKSVCFGVRTLFSKGSITFFCNFLPDILWAYALTFAINMAWVGARFGIVKTLLVCVVFEVGIEFSQLIGVMQGTFDWLDILFEFCATTLAALIIKRKGETRI